MGRIIVSHNVTVDGVVQDPAGDEGFRRGGWVGPITDRREVNEATLTEALEAEALLLGRRSYEWFASRWPSRTGALADRINGVPKYVVSATLEAPGWSNTTVLTGHVVDGVSNLKTRIDGRIVVWASFGLVHSLMQHDLVDELRLKIYPIVLGAGGRPFGELPGTVALRLADVRTLDGDVAFLTYERLRDA